ncbi:MAG TPA: hypothetical protein VGF76_03610 [Polyangiaceae bacterium]
MNKDESKKSELEGEGSYSATRRYNQHLGEAIDSGDIEAAADEARRALEGPEGPELRRAEQDAKNGPKRKPNALPTAKPARAK